MVVKKKPQAATPAPVQPIDVGDRVIINGSWGMAATVLCVDVDANVVFVKTEEGETKPFNRYRLTSCSTSDELKMLDAQLKNIEVKSKEIQEELDRLKQRAATLRNRRTDVRQRLLQETAKEHGFDHIVFASGSTTSIDGAHVLFKVR